MSKYLMVCPNIWWYVQIFDGMSKIWWYVQDLDYLQVMTLKKLFKYAFTLKINSHDFMPCSSHISQSSYLQWTKIK